MAVVALLGLIAMAQANQDPYYARRATLFDELPIGKKDIVMLGNSLTDGCEFNELLNNKHIKNRGIVGDIVQGMIDRIGPIIKGQPKKLFIMCGVNDISHDVSADSIAWSSRDHPGPRSIFRVCCPSTMTCVSGNCSRGVTTLWWRPTCCSSRSHAARA